MSFQRFLAFSKTYGFQIGVLVLAGATGATKAVDKIRRHQRGDAADFWSVYGLKGLAQTVMLATWGSSRWRNLLIISAVLAKTVQRIVLMYFPMSRLAASSKLFYICFFGVVWKLYYQLFCIELPALSYTESPFVISVLEHMKVRRHEFRPVFWAFSGHAQTVLNNYINSFDSLLKRFEPYQREAIESFDGNFVYLDWALPDASTGHTLGPSSPIVFITPGIFGSAEDNYCRNLTRRCTENGWRAVVHFRWRLDFGCSADLKIAMNHIHNRYPDAPIVGVGYSAGGHVLLAYLQAVGDQTPLVGAVVTSPAFDLVRVLNYVDGTSGAPVYGRALRGALTRCIQRHLENDSTLSEETVRLVESDLTKYSGSKLYDYFISRIGTYAGKEADEDGSAVPIPSKDRYGNNTSGHYALTAAENMHKIAITTMVIMAWDDPIMPEQMTREVVAASVDNPNVIFMTTNRGGHVGYQQGLWPTGHSYVDDVTADYSAAIIAMHAHTRYILDVVRGSADGGDASATIRRIVSQPEINRLDSGTGFGRSASGHLLTELSHIPETSSKRPAKLSRSISSPRAKKHT